MNRKITLPTGLIAIVAIVVAVVMYRRAEREKHRTDVATQAMTAWAQDMVQEKKDLPHYLPLAKKAIALQRPALANDPVAFSSTLFTYLLMSAFTHIDFMGHSEVPAPVHQFEADTMNELTDITLSLLEKQDDRALAFMIAFTDGDQCGEGALRAKCDRVVLMGARRIADHLKAGNKEFEKLGHDLASRLNSRAWEAVVPAGKAGDVYAQGYVAAQAAVAADSADADYQNTLALAAYRAGQLEPAAQAIARAIDLRKDHVPDTTDLAIKAVIDAKAGRGDAARAALKTIDERRAKSLADAAAKGQKPSTFDTTVTALMAEAHAILK